MTATTKLSRVERCKPTGFQQSTDATYVRENHHYACSFVQDILATVKSFHECK